MDRLALLVEQLDRAADELERGGAIEARLALMLVDNACELMLHQKCEAMVRMDAPSWLREPKYSKAERQRALGQDFEKKVSFLERHGLIKGDEAAFLKAAHALRNSAYHVGLTDDGISHPVATVYYQLAAQLLLRLGRGFRSYSLTQEYGERFVKHLTDSRKDLWFLEFKDEDITASLLNRCPQDAKKLSEALSKRLIEELDELRNQLDFLVQDDPRKLNEEDAVLLAQISMEESRWSADLPFPHEEGYSEAVIAMREAVAQMYKPKFSRIPFETWRRSTERLSTEKNPLRAMEKFSNLLRVESGLCKLRLKRTG